MVVTKKSKQEIEDIYQGKTLHEHILSLPDTYIEGVIGDMREMWVYDEDDTRMVKKDITYIPGLYKIFDEVLVNARDQSIRESTCRTIKINVDKATGMITVWNDGPGIQVQIHKKYNIYVPEMIFSQLLTSTNYDQVGKTWGGKNGYGAKLANIYSTYFCVETVDMISKQKYKQVFENNMYTINPPEIETVTPRTKPWTRISFSPDYAKFGTKGLTNDTMSLFKKRAYDIAACAPAGCKIYLNDELINVNSFQDYIKLYYKDYPSSPVYEECGPRWKVCAIFDSNSEFRHMSFVNGICTYKGGTHVNHVFDQIVKRLIAHIEEKHNNLKIKPYQVRDNLTVFIDAVIEDPKFSSQTKEELTSKVVDFGSVCELSDEFIKQLIKSGIVDEVVALAQFKENAELKKSDGKKTQSIMGIEKYDKAIWAGTKKSNLCRLILTEGDSAKKFALDGLDVVGKEQYGVFPLKGKPLNVREATVKQLKDNEELNNIKKILGLKQYKKYTDTKSLNYGGIIIITDSDVDGSHIKGLLINLIQCFWPSLLINVPNFIQTLLTPIVKVWKKSDTKKANPIKFYTLSEYQKWTSENDTKNWVIKYYKGLGTSSDKEARESFKEFDQRLISYIWENSKEEGELLKETKTKHIDEESDSEGEDEVDNEVSDCDDIDFESKSYDAITLAFSKCRANDRKNWLFNYDKDDIIEDSVIQVPLSEFINKELKHFSNSDNVRSIPSLCDGFKPSQRKILFAAFKKNIVKDEIKVEQFAGFVSEHAEYHHGGASLQGAIINMAQTFVGSNNINIFTPIGNFGSRRSGGKDAASSRYTFIQLSHLMTKIFKKEDEKIYNYIPEDGMLVEPEFYSPIIPMILVNGALGIGTGFSTSIPSFNPLDIVNNLLKIMDDRDPIKMMPWYRGFKGSIKYRDNKVISIGKYEVIDENTMRITELPIGTWTEKYKEFLESISITDKNDKTATHIVAKFDNFSSNNIINFVITFTSNNLQSMIKTCAIEKKMKLTSSVQVSNMYMYNSKGVITKYETVDDILIDFYKHRLEMYEARKRYMIRMLENQLNIIRHKIMFIDNILKKKIILDNKRKAEVHTKLDELHFQKLSSDPDALEADKSYDYLLMSIWSLTIEKIEELNKEYEEKQKELNDYRTITLQALWRRELTEFVESYKKWFDEQEILDNQLDQKKPRQKAVAKPKQSVASK